MWIARPMELDRQLRTSENAIRFELFDGDSELTFGQVLTLWANQPEFRDWFNDLLADVPFAAFNWETPPLTARQLDRAFEFAVLDNPGLDRTPNPADFSSQFKHAGPEDVIEFPNLGKNAILVVPSPPSTGSHAGYCHLASFVRQAPARQKSKLWEVVAHAMKRRLQCADPVWLSTAGGGVPWLHIRLDDRPKYYRYQPYSEAGNRA